MKEVVIIGYSGHGLVAAEILTKAGHEIIGYCDQNEKELNPFNLPFLGSEDNYFSLPRNCHFFVAIGDNRIRHRVLTKLVMKGYTPINAVHPSAQIAKGVVMGHGILIGPQVIINPCSDIGDGVILNSACVIEHECSIGVFSHISPGATLCGNVRIGAYTWIGANAVVKQNISIGDFAMIGAGSVIIKDIPNMVTVVGNPGKLLNRLK